MGVVTQKPDICCVTLSSGTKRSDVIRFGNGSDSHESKLYDTWVYLLLFTWHSCCPLSLSPPSGSRQSLPSLYITYLLLHITDLLPPFLPALFPQAQSPPPSNSTHDYAPGQLGGWRGCVRGRARTSQPIREDGESGRVSRGYSLC